MAELGDHMDIERGHKRVHANQKSSEEHEVELVVTNPELANLIHYTCVSAGLIVSVLASVARPTPLHLDR